MPVQGNLDPLVLLAGGEALDRAVDAISTPSAAAVHLQSRPRHPAGDADRACGADARRVRGDGADRCRNAKPGVGGDRDCDHLLLAACSCGGGRPALSLAQGAARHRRHRLDGGDALSAAAVRLSLRGRAGSKQSETFKVMERRLLTAIINPAMVVTWVLGLWLALAGRLVRAGWLHAKFVLVLAVRRCTDFSCAGCSDFAADRKPALAEILSDRQRGPDRPDDRHRDPGDREAVLRRLRRTPQDDSHIINW